MELPEICEETDTHITYKVYASKWKPSMNCGNYVVEFNCPFCRDKYKGGSFKYTRPYTHQHGSFSQDETSIDRTKHCREEDIPKHTRHYHMDKNKGYSFRIFNTNTKDEGMAKKYGDFVVELNS